MHLRRLSSCFALALAAVACSDSGSSSSNPSSTQTEGNASTPAASNGGGAATSTGSAGTAGSAATAGSGGSTSEAPNTGIGLNQGGTSSSTSGGAMAGAAGSGMAGSAGAAGSSALPPPADAGVADTMSFFLSSRGSGNGGNFGGIAGADQLCTTLATEVSPALGAKTWRAYLSTSTEDARDRIGDGPWRNAAGVIVGNDIDQIHDQAAGGASEETWPLADASIALDERGQQLPGNPVLHDILTGSNADGTVSASGTCADWTSEEGTTRAGHSDRMGGMLNPSPWNSAHDTGCAEPDPGSNFQQGTVSQGGGRGAIYCFAID